MPLNARGRHTDFTLPDPSSLGLAWPELQGAIDEHGRLVRERGLAGRRLGVLEDDHHRAVDGDAKRGARAVREGKPEPEPKATMKIEVEMAGVRRRVEALGVAIEEVEGELVALVDEHRDRYAEDVAGRIARDRTHYAKAIDLLEGVRGELMGHFGLASWLRTFPDGRGFAAPTGHLFDLRAPSGDPYPAATVLAALRAEAAPEPVPVPAPVEVAP